MSTTMSTVIFIPASSLLQSSSSSSSSRKISSLCSFSNSAVSIPKNAIFQHFKCVPLLGLTPFSQWSGLKNMGVSISCPVKMERKGKCKGKGVYASLFGVGAPEVLVIGVVALLVFGPKGLAEVARNLGKTLRAFQPTIRELQEVSREFKSTLEREIGLDDIDTPVPKRSNTTEPTPEPNGSSAETAEDPADSALKMKADKFRGALAQLQKEQEEERLQKEEEEKQTEEEQRQKEEAQSEGQVVESEATSQETSEAPDTPQAEDTAEETSSVTPPSENSNSNALQEVGAGAPNGLASNTETQS